MPSRLSFPKICIALGLPTPEELFQHACREATAGETFLEFRLDFLPDPRLGFDVMRRFLARYPDCSILATCRRHQNHGRYNGSIDEQLEILSGAVDAGAFAVDVEIESAEISPSRLHRFDGRVQLVVSYHNFEGTPALDPVFRRMSKIPAAAYKIVTMARKPSDNLRVLHVGRTNPKTPLVMLAMGEIGFPTRVLSAVHGGLFTYAAPSAAEGTAAGQVCAQQLRNVYRLEKLSRAAKVYGVIADPVRHSISPAVQNRAMQARRLDAVYLPFLVAPLQLKDFFSLAEKLPIGGVSVTIPHKQRVIRYLDALDPLAKRIGAVNTIWRKAGKWRGTNTDAEGVRVPLEKRLRLPKCTALIAGNGGAARSAAFTLAHAGAKIAVVGRNPDRVRALAKACDGEALSKEEAEARKFDILIHATPLGMWPHPNEAYFMGKIPAKMVFDMVYTPQQTLLLKRAAQQGAEIIPGIEMFLEQAAAQFELWTGETAPRAAMQQAAIEALAAQEAQLKRRDHNHDSKR
jgi:3-dehydroquinate dehydratase/shikimate dehydrogenase